MSYLPALTLNYHCISIRNTGDGSRSRKTKGGDNEFFDNSDREDMVG